ncbi:MAG: EI24 domain-containing protein, partial [Spirochaetota bacterium]
LALHTPLSDLEAGVLKEIVPELERILNRTIPDAPSLQGNARQQRIVFIITQLLQRQTHPTLLLLEDLHWVRESLEVLTQLTGHIETLPLMIVGSYRRDERPRLPEELPTDVQMIMLSRFEDTRIRQLAKVMLGDIGQQPAVVAQLQQETEGNVFFLVETLRAWAEEAGGLFHLGIGLGDNPFGYVPGTFLLSVIRTYDLLALMNRFLKGFLSFFAGARVIATHNLWTYILFPSLLSLASGVFIIYGTFHFFSGFFTSQISKFVAYLMSFLGYSLASSHDGLLLFSKVIAFFCSVLVYIILYTPLASVIIIPFLGYLLAKLEELYLGKTIEVPIWQDIRNAFLGFFLSLLFTLYGLLAFFLGLFLGPLQPVLVVLVNGYILGRSSFEYLLEKDYPALQERKQEMKNFYQETFGLGVAQVLFLFIPIFGVILAPSFALCGAFLLYHKIESSKKK